MRLLANENFPGAAVRALRDRGHDIGWIRTDAPGSSDEEVFARAVAEERIVLTFDKDFGELVFRMKLAPAPGVILFRMPPVSPSFVAETAVAALAGRSDWAGHFSVVEPGRVRMVELPG